MCGGFAGTRGFSQGRRQFFQPPPLCCVRSWAVRSFSQSYKDRSSNWWNNGTVCLFLFSLFFFFRIHDNEGAVEMLIDTLGPAIVNAKDSKNRWDVSGIKQKQKWLFLFFFFFLNGAFSWLVLGCRTPLHAAAFTDHVECLQLLLSHNAQVNSVDAAGKTPLMMAAENGQTNAVGTENSVPTPEDIPVDRNNWRCLGLTLFYLLADCLELLVSSAKADLTLQDAVKNTALHLACSKVGITVWCHILTFHCTTCTACSFKHLLNHRKRCVGCGRTQLDEVNDWE